MKVTDGTEGPTNKDVPRSKGTTAEQQQPVVKDSKSGEADPGANGTADMTSSSSGGEDQEYNRSLNGSASPTTMVINGSNNNTGENGGTSSDKENSKPSRKGGNKKAKSSAKTSKSNRSSEERTTVKVTNGVNNKGDAADGSAGDDETEANESEGNKKENADAKAEEAEDVFYVHDAGLTIKIVAPGAEPFEIQVKATTIVFLSFFFSVQEVRILINDSRIRKQVNDIHVIQVDLLRISCEFKG